MPNLLDSLIALVLTVWFCLAVLSQFRPAWLQQIKYFDLLHLIPNFRFFAPHPARRDYYLEFRCRLNSDTVGRWQRVMTMAPRGLSCALWHPGKRRRKAFSTLTRRLLRVSVAHGPDRAGRTVAYLTLLNHVQGFLADERGDVQFRLVTGQHHCPARPIRLAFTSDWHAASPRAGERHDAAR